MNTHYTPDIIHTYALAISILTKTNNTTMTTNEIQSLIQYATEIIGTKYVWWIEGETTDEIAHPFYVKQLPSKEYLEKNGINCAGVINYLLLKLGKDVKGFGPYIGGTYQWYSYFNSNNMLHKIDCNKNYPIGSLFIREYIDAEDQGHLAILYNYDSYSDKTLTDSDKTLTDSDIIHAWTFGEYPNNNGGVIVNKFTESHSIIDGGYYNYVVYPEDWLK